MIKKEIKQRIEKLKSEINHHRHLYHVLDRQEISDSALDSLKHELYKLEQENPEFLTMDSPTQRVGGEALQKFNKVEHKTRMLSMEDIFNFVELEEWEARLKRLFSNKHFDYFAEVKMDGLSASLEYQDGVLQIGSTRGDGKVGEDVTQNLKTIEAIPLRLCAPKDGEIEKFLQIYKDVDKNIFRKKIKNLSGRIEVRGEVFMDKKVFENLNKSQKKKDEKIFANPRNVAAGSIRQLNSKITAVRKLDFYGYDLLADFGHKTHEEAHQILRLLGIKINPLMEYCRDLKAVDNFYKKLGKKREKLNYWMDGIVVNVNNIDLFKKLGVVGKTPRGMIAYKYPGEEATTKLLQVDWQVGRTGALTPRATLEPAQVMGTKVTHATLHNADEIWRLDVKIGDTVVLEKAGDIIPKIKSVLKNLRIGSEYPIAIPRNCPICGSNLEKKIIKKSINKEEVGTILYCINRRCPAKGAENIKHFVSKKAFDIEGLGERIVEHLIDEKLISTTADIFTLTKQDLEPLERFAEKSVQNLLDSIEKSKKISLSRFLYALGIPNIGEETANALARHFGKLEKIVKAKKEDFESVSDIGNVVADSLIEYFKDERHQKLIDDLQKNGVKIEELHISQHLPLKGKVFVLTGGLDNMTREDSKERIRELGGDVSSSVSKNTDYLVAGADPGIKYNKAKQLNVKILNEAEFLKLLK